MPYTYLWSDGQTTATASNLWAGNYTATITDVNGCTTTTTATIVAPAALTVLADGSEILSSTVFVHQTEIIVDGGVAPYSYQWDNNGYVSYDISYDAAGNGYVSLQYGQTAVWAVTITDSNDCGVVVLGNTPIDEPLSISNYTIANDDGTNSGSVSIVAEGGTAPYSYEWFGPSDWVPVGSVTSNQLSNLPSGWYTVYVTDAAGNEISGWYWVASSTRGRGKTDDLDLGDASSLSVYPNPVKQHATIEYIGMQNEYVYVELFDITGKSAMKLFEGEVQAAKPLFLDIDSRQLTPGAYVCQVRNTKDVIQTIRLVIAK
ncbi:MAG: T9SS type A sorting domain-containing protein [Sphingobacteriales bacterium]|nr:T9SS type A sorting domain-containing protein [Sphingobacteriales bacterium]